MKKLLIAFICALVSIPAFSAWPLGNIGIDVPDRPATVLDVGKVAGFRKGIIIPSNDDHDGVAGIIDNTEAGDEPGIYFGIDSNDGAASIKLNPEDPAAERLVFHTQNPIFEHGDTCGIEFRSSDDGVVSHIGRREQWVTDADGHNIKTNRVYVGPGYNELDVFVEDDNVDSVGTVLDFRFAEMGSTYYSTHDRVKALMPNPIKIRIFTNGGLGDDLPQSIAVKVNGADFFFSENYDGCLYIELMYIPVFRTGESTDKFNYRGKLVYLSGIHISDGGELFDNAFDNRWIYVDGTRQ